MLLKSTTLSNIFSEDITVNLKEISPGRFSVEIVFEQKVPISKNFVKTLEAALSYTALCELIEKYRLHSGKDILEKIVSNLLS